MKLNKKGNATIAIVILIILLISSLGYIAYDKGIFNGIINKYTKNETKKSNKKVKLINGYQFDVDDVECENDAEVCEKVVKLSYNNKNHNITVTPIIKDDVNEVTAITTLKYEIKIDGEMVNTIDAGSVYSGQEIDDLVNVKLYVIDKKYLAIGYYVYDKDDKNTYIELSFYNDLYVDKVALRKNNQKFKINDGYLNEELDSVKFDGNSFTTYEYDCTEANIKVKEMKLSFDGEKITSYFVQNRDDIESVGQNC